ncbi:Uncharacterized membrane protein YeiH [Pseudarcicella hirudinis]|uniref:Uncharacterized membrane protein YeiH n=1 Tax=Pseudarcicella hirudinis TaxID=1079859 RepID=A0A1I5PN57_9BACT|nr:trimeric intracellular cation channel family protein [Pseudarcicella hirudinis]SFP35528.1 Uncharacterized membrane protein YeiH [Pseudarcicella hirudinis]
MTVLSVINICGTLAFTISGAYAGMQKRLDLFGIIVIAFVTSIGGGTIRDVLIGTKPVRWVIDTPVIYLIIFATLLSVFGKNYIKKIDSPLLLFDALGLGCFFVTGYEQASLMSLPAATCVIIGTITACFGGVIRDILLNEIPVLFRKEIYATACILGGTLHYGLGFFSELHEYAKVITLLFIFAVRILSIRNNISLPKIKLDN